MGLVCKQEVHMRAFCFLQAFRMLFLSQVVVCCFPFPFACFMGLFLYFVCTLYAFSNNISA